MSSDGVVLNDVWEYSISAAPELRIQFQDRTEDVHASPMNIPYARFGATLAPFGDSLLLVGGIASKEILSLSDEFVVITAGAKILLETPTLQSDNASWPLLVGAGVAAVSADEVLIAGGGAVCFSMGSFWNSGYVSVAKGGKPDAQAWSVSILEGSALPQSGRNPSDNANANLKSPGKVNPKRNSKGRDTAKQKVYTVPRMRVQSAEDFSRLVQESKPAILEQLDLGPCTELWTLDYLKEKLGADREIVIHECTSDRMTFKDKNFQYVKKSIGEFLDGIAGGSQTYLRAVSATQPNKLPTKLEEDFPAIAADFQLPEVLDSIKETYHSSPLRISGPVSLWLHYDVLANVLCQIKGSKTMRLYPPSDVKYLDYPPGGSSSNTNVLVSKEAKLRHTHPHVASLKPGDVLFIPPMWSHTATPEEGYSVAVNVFFRNLEKGYAAGKDVYGNRDLQAYENGRRDIEKILRAFKDIPDDVSKFYLDRLAAELQARADERR
jgi:tRNA wybutosine-synthesizing protein 4